MTEEEKSKSKKDSARKWREKNKNSILKKQILYRKNLPKKDKTLLSDDEKVIRQKEANLNWRKKNKEYYKEYRINNREKLDSYYKEYLKNNRSDVYRKSAIRNKNRFNNDNVFKCKVLTYRLIKKSIMRNGFTKKSKTYQILGCSFQDFKNYLESKFETWMNWGNYGMYNGQFNYGWDIDHIIPSSSARTEEEILRLNNYSNFQPLDSKINRDIKKHKLNYEVA